MFLLWLTIWIRATSTASLYAYSTAKGVQVGAQDPKTGELHYSNCNSEKTPIFPIDKPNVLKVGLMPRKGTALAAAGWWDGQKVTASIFYQTDESVIVNAYCECNMTTGKLTYIDNWAISETAEVKSVNNETGLSVQLLGGEEGYRLFYHNKDGDVMMLRIFYFGADKKLYQVTENNDEWELAPNQTDNIWPQADDSSADLAVANDQGNGETWIYYWANDSIVQVHRKNSKDWEPAKMLPVNATNSANQNSEGNKGSQESADSLGSKDLSTGAKAGIGVGVSMGVILMTGLIWFLMKRLAAKKGRDTEADGDPAPDQSPGSPEVDETATLKPVSNPSLDDTPKADPVEMESPRVMAELEHPPVIYELPENDGKQ
ncbi:hypothetical protein NCS55_01362400 [Fusarium keratoplasticum]|nr:hypothetical protein NCS55_01362400 [Fusarium keratoplasticum]